MNMKDSMRTAVAGALLMLPGPISAQCAQQYGDIGITGLACDDCVISAPTGNAQWRFAAEPGIARIASGSPAEAHLRVGDVITAVNGESITTSAGARALSRLHPTQPVALTIRRDDAIHNFLITPRAVCPTSALLGMAPAAQVAATRSVVSTSGARGGSVARSSPPAQNATPLDRGAPVQAARSSSVALRSNAWVGIAFACRDCKVVAEGGVTRWSFTNPPEVYSVETGSPAHRAGIRRGDVLTHVDNHTITSAEGGRRWATLQPGETVRVRYRRPDAAGSTPTRTATISVAKPRSVASTPAQAQTVERELRALEASLAMRDTASARVLRAYQEALRRQTTEQQRILNALNEQLRSGTESGRREAETILQEYMRQQERTRSEQQKLYAEAVRLQTVEAQRAVASRKSLEELSAKIAPTTVAATTVTGVRTSAEQRARFSGTIRGTEVEVRSAQPVAVTERGNELVITMHDSTIIVRVPDRR